SSGLLATALEALPRLATIEAERELNQRFLLHFVARRESGRRRCRYIAPSIAWAHAFVTRFVECRFDLAVDEEPRAVVAGFLLTPDDILKVGHTFETDGQRLTRERIE